MMTVMEVQVLQFQNDNTKPSKPNGQEDSNVTLNPGLNTDNSDSNN